MLIKRAGPVPELHVLLDSKQIAREASVGLARRALQHVAAIFWMPGRIDEEPVLVADHLQARKSRRSDQLHPIRHCCLFAMHTQRDMDKEKRTLLFFLRVGLGLFFNLGQFVEDLPHTQA